MKKILYLSLLIFFITVQTVFATGSCLQTHLTDQRSGTVKAIFTCTGDVSNGTVPNSEIDPVILTLVNGLWLYTVTTYPTSGGTAPDAADVSILVNGLDILGGKGANLIHATLTQDTFPYSIFMSMYRYFPIIGTFEVRVASQATASANYTIELLFGR